MPPADVVNCWMINCSEPGAKDKGMPAVICCCASGAIRTDYVIVNGLACLMAILACWIEVIAVKIR